MMSRDGGKGMARMAQMMGAQLPGMPSGGADLARMKAMGGGKLGASDPVSSPPPGLPGLGNPTNPPGGLPGLGGLFKPKS
jgi:signal recognition particle subunit SRP54